MVDGPVLGVLPDRRRPDEQVCIDRDPGFLTHLDDRLDVGHDGSARAVSLEVKPLRRDFLRETQDVRLRARTGAGQANIDGVDAQLGHQMQNSQLVFDLRIGHRRRLDAVAQRLVVELRLRAVARRLIVSVPVMDQRLMGHTLEKNTGRLPKAIGARTSIGGAPPRRTRARQ